MLETSEVEKFKHPFGAIKQWTLEEHTLLQSAVHAAVQFTRVQERFAGVIGTAPKVKVVQILKDLEMAHRTGMNFLDALFSSESSGNRTRESEVNRVFASAKKLNEHRDSLLEALTLVVVDPEGEAALQRATAELKKIDVLDFGVNRGFRFQEHRVPDWPRSVGPHGSATPASAHLEHSYQYEIHTLHDGIRFWEEVTDPPLSQTAANENFQQHTKTLFVFLARTLRKTLRAWSMDGTVVLPDDENIIHSDDEAASGLRPFDFHRLMRMIEILFSNGGTNFAAREVERGATRDIRRYMDAFTSMVLLVAQTSPSELAVQWNRRHGALSDSGSTGGWAAEFFHDVPDFWRAFDFIAYDWFGFQHVLGGPPDHECPSFHTSVDVVINGVPVTCVEDTPEDTP